MLRPANGAREFFQSQPAPTAASPQDPPAEWKVERLRPESWDAGSRFLIRRATPGQSEFGPELGPLPHGSPQASGIPAHSKIPFFEGLYKSRPGGVLPGTRPSLRRGSVSGSFAPARAQGGQSREAPNSHRQFWTGCTLRTSSPRDRIAHAEPEHPSGPPPEACAMRPPPDSMTLRERPGGELPDPPPRTPRPGTPATARFCGLSDKGRTHRLLPLPMQARGSAGRHSETHAHHCRAALAASGATRTSTSPSAMDTLAALRRPRHSAI